MLKPRPEITALIASLALAASLLAAAGPGGATEDPVKTQKNAPPKSPAAPPGSLHIISSSHQDIAWMDSPEKCIVFRDTNCITPALAMMAKDPAYSFTMENMLNLMEYVERHPERAEEIARLTREGRMEWGATFNQPYESLYSGEQLIRQAYFGRFGSSGISPARTPASISIPTSPAGPPRCPRSWPSPAFPTWS